MGSPNSTVVQVTVDKDLKSKLDFMTKHGGHDTSASLVRFVMRNYYKEFMKKEMPNKTTIQSIKDAEREIALNSGEDAEEFLKKIINEKSKAK